MNRNFVRTGLAIILLLAGVGASAVLVFRAWACGVDVIDRLALPDSGWEVRAEVSGCSAVDGNLSIVAEYTRLPLLRRELVRYGHVPDVKLVLAGESIVVTSAHTVQATMLVERFKGRTLQLRTDFDGRFGGN